MKNKIIITSLLLVLAGSIFLFFPKKGATPGQSLPPPAPVALDNAPFVDNKQPASGDTAISTDTIKIFDTVKDEVVLRDVIHALGIKKTMGKLVAESGGGSTLDCHQQAHQIGRVGYELYKEKAFQSCDASCHSGCYHGAMEKFLNEKGTAHLAADIHHVCSLFDTSFGTFECLHGVGHGVLAYDDYDMPEALKECGKLSGGFEQSSCYGGVFMENILTGQGLGASEKEDHATTWVNKTDPLYPCDVIDKDPSIQYQCYQMQTSWMLTLYNYNFDRVAGVCTSQAPEAMKSICFKSLGRDIAGYTLRNPARIVELCGKVPQENGYYDQCVVGAVNVIVDFWGPGLTDEASALCTLLSEPDKKICYETLAGRLAGLFGNDSQKQSAVCKTFEPAYQNLCKN